MTDYQVGFSTKTEDIVGCCYEYMTVADALISHIQIENDLLFAGNAREFLKDKMVTSRKAWLFTAHKFTAERIMERVRDVPRDGVSTMLKEEVTAKVGVVRRLLKINQALLSDEITRKEKRVDAIMQRIRLLEQLQANGFRHPENEVESQAPDGDPSLSLRMTQRKAVILPLRREQCDVAH